MKNDEILVDKKKKDYNIKEFGKSFEINNIGIDTSKLPLLKYIFREFSENIYVMSEENNKLNKKKIEIQKELYKTLTDEQKEKFEEYWEIENQMATEIEEQIFMYGFIMSKELEKEKNTINENLLK